ncbi:hypothetical protein ACA910_009758 [Epithemia clementina (nom. ined.)]
MIHKADSCSYCCHIFCSKCRHFLSVEQEELKRAHEAAARAKLVALKASKTAAAAAERRRQQPQEEEQKETDANEPEPMDTTENVAARAIETNTATSTTTTRNIFEPRDTAPGPQQETSGVGTENDGERKEAAMGSERAEAGESKAAGMGPIKETTVARGDATETAACRLAPGAKNTETSSRGASLVDSSTDAAKQDTTNPVAQAEETTSTSDNRQFQMQGDKDDGGGGNSSEELLDLDASIETLDLPKLDKNPKAVQVCRRCNYCYCSQCGFQHQCHRCGCSYWF